MSDRDFLIVIHSNFLATMYGFLNNKVVSPTGYDVIVSPPPGSLQAIFFMTDAERATMTS